MEGKRRQKVDGFSLCGSAAVTENNLRDEYYWKLVADFIGPQSGEGLELETRPCKNRLLIQVGLLREDKNFPWVAILNWLKAIFRSHSTADFRRLIDTGIATTLSLGTEARQTFLETDVNFDFVGPICDSIGVERRHLLEMRDISERARSIEVTNGLILELSNFITREKLAPIVIVPWLINFNSELCKNGNIQKAYQILKPRIKKIQMHSRLLETRSHRRDVAIENLLHSPFVLVEKKKPRSVPEKRMRKDEAIVNDKVKEEYESYEIMQGEGSDRRGVVKKVIVKERVVYGESDEDASGNSDDTQDKKDGVLTLLDFAMLSAQKLSGLFRMDTAAYKEVCLELLNNQYAMLCKEHPSLAEFEEKLSPVREALSLAPPVVFLDASANFLVDVHDAIEEHIVNFEKGTTLGRDKLPKFRNFVNLKESATSRYIHMVCEVLRPGTPDTLSYRKHWLAFCEEKKNPSRLVINHSNRFINYLEVAAGLIHHHKEIALFFSDLMSLDNNAYPNVILESVAADAADSVIQSFVCVIALIYCKILGPYWQLMRSGGEYSQFGSYLLRLYQRFLDWSKESVTLLEPEDATDVFLQCPAQQKTFSGVFEYCGHWRTNRDMIRNCLKGAIKVIAGITEKHLKDFLPGGVFSQVPPPECSVRLVSCTFSVLMVEYPDGYKHPFKQDRYDSSSDSSLDDGDDVVDDTPQKEAKGVNLKRKVRIQRQEVEENLDREYIIATVDKNGGPCRTKHDLERMTLRFDGKSLAEKREGYRCEILYQKMILDNTSPHLNCIFRDTSNMIKKLSMALPRAKPGYALVAWTPKYAKMQTTAVPRTPVETPAEQKESSSSSGV